MFNDKRSKRVIFITHRPLNQSVISDGTAVYLTAFRDIIDFFLNAGINIVQMPYSEFCCLGLSRGNIHGADNPVVVENMRIHSAIENDSTNMRLSRLADYIVQQIIKYRRYGFEIIGIIGANRSPNYGVETTSDNNAEISGMKLFVEEIVNQLL